MTFSEQLKPLVEAIGTNESARICGVTARTIQIWMRGPREPSAASQSGALKLLREKTAKIKCVSR